MWKYYVLFFLVWPSIYTERVSKFLCVGKPSSESEMLLGTYRFYKIGIFKMLYTDKITGMEVKEFFLLSLLLMISWFYFIHFTECNVGFYGNNCDKRCKCNNASCDVVTGVCDCPAGVMPPSCTDSKTLVDPTCSKHCLKAK